MSILPEPVINLIDALASLPGIGPKSASRLALHLIRQSDDDLKKLSQLFGNLKQELVICSTCQNIAAKSPCMLCSDEKRANGTICVVEDALDVVALERAGVFQGRYHVLQGVLSPLDGIGPDQLKIKELERRVKTENITEVILATNPTIEGEATSMYITKRLAEKSNLKITRLAHGLPVGADLEYADEVTLAQALEGRQTVQKDPSIKP